MVQSGPRRGWQVNAAAAPGFRGGVSQAGDIGLRATCCLSLWCRLEGCATEAFLKWKSLAWVSQSPADGTSQVRCGTVCVLGRFSHVHLFATALVHGIFPARIVEWVAMPFPIQGLNLCLLIVKFKEATCSCIIVVSMIIIAGNTLTGECDLSSGKSPGTLYHPLPTPPRNFLQLALHQPCLRS